MDEMIFDFLLGIAESVIASGVYQLLCAWKWMGIKRIFATFFHIPYNQSFHFGKIYGNGRWNLVPPPKKNKRRRIKH